MRRRDFIQFGAGFGSALAGLAPPRGALAQAKAVFKASDVQPAGYPTVVATESLGRKLATATNGRLSVQMYPSMQLGAEKETIEQTQIGAIQILRVSAGAVGPIVDDINVVNMPFLFRETPDQVHRRPQGAEISRHRQSDLHRHDECARRQRRRHGL